MKSIWARFRRKETAMEALERIQKELKERDDCLRSAQANEKKICHRLQIFLTASYLLLAVFSFCNFYYDRLDFSSTVRLGVMVIGLYFVQQSLAWWYRRKVRTNQAQIERLEKEKISMLDKVMETETFKVASDILKKFGRHVPATAEWARPSGECRFRAGVGSADQNKRPSAPVVQPQRAVAAVSSAPPSLPRPVPPQKYGFLDRLIEHLISEGPNHRYALICGRCMSHNGLALQEEFEYVAYRCGTCQYWNPARKQKPSAPRLSSASASGSSTAVRGQSSWSSSSSSSSWSRSRSPSPSPSHPPTAQLTVNDGPDVEDRRCLRPEPQPPLIDGR